MDRWEYEVKPIKPSWESDSPVDVPNAIDIVESFLNGMGEMGWEFVSFLPPISPKRSAVEPLDPSAYYAVFKRRVT
jgi:hypothetical protein